MTTHDFPARIVTTAARLLPIERRDWGAAMIAELAALSDAPDRWRFALGCASTVITAPRHPSAFLLGAAIQGTLIIGIVGCLGFVAYATTTWPHATKEIAPATVASFTIWIAAYLWIAIHPPRMLTGNAGAVRLGAVVGVALVVVVSALRTAIDTFADPRYGEILVGSLIMVSVIGATATPAAVVARRERSFGAGLTAALWVALLASVLAFDADLLGTLLGVSREAHIMGTMPKLAGATQEVFLENHIGSHLSSSMAGINDLVIVALIAGSIAAAIGKRLATRSEARA